MDDHLFRMGNESDAHGSVVIASVRIAKPIRALSLILELLFGDSTVGLAPDVPPSQYISNPQAPSFQRNVDEAPDINLFLIPHRELFPRTARVNFDIARRSATLFEPMQAGIRSISDCIKSVRPETPDWSPERATCPSLTRGRKRDHLFASSRFPCRAICLKSRGTRKKERVAFVIREAYWQMAASVTVRRGCRSKVRPFTRGEKKLYREKESPHTHTLVSSKPIRRKNWQFPVNKVE